MTSPLEVPSSLGITLRPVRAGDEALLFAIYASTRVEELAQTDWNDAQKESFLRMQFDAQRKFYQNEYLGAEFLIILAAGKSAGRLYVHRREKEIRIMDLALLPEFRRLGIGTVLLKEVLTEGRRTARTVTIHVESFNPAQRLYARLGFERVASNGVYHLLEWSGQSPPKSEAEDCGSPSVSDLALRDAQPQSQKQPL